MVEQITRASTCTRDWPPTRVKVWSISTRKDLALGLQRHVGDFVQIQRAVMRQLEQAGLAGRSPLSTPNNSASSRSGAMVAQLIATKALPARRERAWISRAALPCPNRRARRSARGCWWGRSCRSAPATGRWWANCRSARPRRRLQFQLLDFALQARRFQRASSDMQQAVGLERLFDEIIGALA